MGKVLKTFNNGYAGAISHSLDDVVVPFANKSNGAIGFGMPVALNASKTGIVPFDGSTHTAADFIGVTVRNPSKTPDAYGSNTASYGSNDIVDVLVRGRIVVECEGTPSLGAAVSVKTLNGKFATGSGTGLIALTNVHVSATKDAYDMVEILLNTRNLL